MVARALLGDLSCGWVTALASFDDSMVAGALPLGSLPLTAPRAALAARPERWLS